MPRGVCLDCHDDPIAGRKHVHAPVASGDCQACHNPHAAAGEHLFAGSVGESCYGCHEPQALAPVPALAHAPLREGRCEACHDGHASNQPALLRQSAGTLCLSCHAELGDPAQGKAHAPVARGDCSVCHDAHGSAEPAMLKRALPGLCLDCHKLGAAGMSTAHRGFDLAGADCAGCHEPHRSRLPALGRQGSVHTPYAERRCADCHAGSKAPAKPERELCLGCHRSLGEELKTGRVHPALEQGAACSNCHVPHAAAQPWLLAKEQGALCGRCHAEQQDALASAAFAHPPGPRGLCASCHDPHAESTEQLGPTPELCSKCHDFSKHVSHPLGAGVLDPRTGEELGCLSCHAAHGSVQKYFLLDDPHGRLCVQCHTDKIRSR